jgi:hypothetical protein
MSLVYETAKKRGHQGRTVAASATAFENA